MTVYGLAERLRKAGEISMSDVFVKAADELERLESTNADLLTAAQAREAALEERLEQMWRWMEPDGPAEFRQWFDDGGGVL